MSVCLRFRCQFCDDRPDPLTQVRLVTAMRQMTFGEYQDALPGLEAVETPATSG